MRVHVLQHVPFEKLGNIETWFDPATTSLNYTRFFAEDQLPALTELDFLIVLGGPMSVNDEAELPWLRAEKAFIAAAIAAKMPVLGICLGSQLIASALGARVYAGAEKEIGWFPIQGQYQGDKAFNFPDTLDVFHWHGETFDLPAGATLLASSPGCKNQAFQIGERVIGLQFHLETTEQNTASMIEHCSDELQPQRYIQSQSELENTPAANYANIKAVMAQILAYLLRD
jgi:GMP synthase-like glutamine amidotransferase